MSPFHSESAIELGKMLVKQLDTQNDLLGSWMAHDIAQKIEDAESGTPEAKKACAKAIFDLWEHRAFIPKHLRPMNELETVARAIASLDVDQTEYHYFPQTLREVALAQADESTKQWLDLALGLDYSARLLIQYALKLAVENAPDEAESWIRLARDSGAAPGVEDLVVHFVSEDSRKDGTHEEQAGLEDKVGRLEGFAKLAMTVASEMRSKVDSGTAPEKNS